MTVKVMVGAHLCTEARDLVLRLQLILPQGNVLKCNMAEPVLQLCAVLQPGPAPPAHPAPGQRDAWTYKMQRVVQHKARAAGDVQAAEALGLN